MNEKRTSSIFVDFPHLPCQKNSIYSIEYAQMKVKRVWTSFSLQNNIKVREKFLFPPVAFHRGKISHVKHNILFTRIFIVLNLISKWDLNTWEKFHSLVSLFGYWCKRQFGNVRIILDAHIPTHHRLNLNSLSAWSNDILFVESKCCCCGIIGTELGFRNQKFRKYKFWIWIDRYFVIKYLIPNFEF